MGFLKPEMPRDRHRRVEQGHPQRKDPPDGQALGRGGLRHAGRHSPVLRRQNPAVHPGRLAVFRGDHRRLGRRHRRRALVRRADRVREGRALHDVVRGDRAGLRLRAVEQPVSPADGLDPVLAAPRHHPAATVAGSRPVDQGQCPHTGGCRAVCRAAVDDLRTLFADGTGPVPELGTTVGLLPTWRVCGDSRDRSRSWGCATR